MRIPTLIFLASVSMAASAAEAVFDFANPGTLCPAEAVPALKEAINMDGRAFTDAGVEVSFEATSEGNTHVRLYGSYDAGTDLRLYDGDTMRLRCLDNGTSITGVKVTISLSGGNSDAWFIPSAGEWIWEQDCWVPAEGEAGVADLVLVSYQQSRITHMTVTTAGSTGVRVPVPDADCEPIYYTVTGLRVFNPGPGIYLCRRGSVVKKIVIR